jgi:hypothetical protein
MFPNPILPNKAQNIAKDLIPDQEARVEFMNRLEQSRAKLNEIFN